jgi:hypothetical protein
MSCVFNKYGGKREKRECFQLTGGVWGEKFLPLCRDSVGGVKRLTMTSDEGGTEGL